MFVGGNPLSARLYGSPLFLAPPGGEVHPELNPLSLRLRIICRFRGTNRDKSLTSQIIIVVQVSVLRRR